jgi:hypothetical protein
MPLIYQGPAEEVKPANTGGGRLEPIGTVEVSGAPNEGLPRWESTGGGAALGKPRMVNRTNVLPEPRPTEAFLAGLAKSAVIDPVLGTAQLLSGGNIGGQKAQGYATEAKPYQEVSPGAFLGGQVAGSLLPGTAAAKGIGMIPSFAKAPTLAQGVTYGATQGLITPEETGKTGAEYYQGQGKQGLIGAGLGVVPSALGKGTELLSHLLRKSAGVTTGAGDLALSEAYKAGKEGNKIFTANMRNEVPMENVLNEAKGSLANMQKALSEEYRSGMMDISKDKSVLDFGNIDKSIKNAKGIVGWEGQVINEKGYEKLRKVEKAVNQWKSLDPVKFRTPEAMDKFKQKIGGILEEIPFEDKTAREVVGNIYHSIKDEISAQAPTYSKVMKDYHEGSDLITEIKKSLSLGQKSTTAQGLGKLQSIMRNNANTNWGYRKELTDKLMKEGGGDLMPALAGQALSSWTPRGLVGQGLDVGAGYHLLSDITKWPAALLTGGITSPRIMGNAAYGAGQIAGATTDEQKKLAQLLMIKAAEEAKKGVGNE